MWIIDRDHVDTQKNGHTSRPLKPGETPDYTQKWQAFDDDGELYYEGRATANVEFQPLDWAMWYAGATRIDYLNPKTGNWETL